MPTSLLLKAKGDVSVFFRRVAPMVEHRIPNPGVGSSSLSTPATPFIIDEANELYL